MKSIVITDKVNTLLAVFYYALGWLWLESLPPPWEIFGDVSQRDIVSIMSWLLVCVFSSVVVAEGVQLFSKNSNLKED